MFASIPSAVVLGARGHRVNVEVHIDNGLPSFSIVGMPDESVRESRDRCRAAVMSSGAKWPGQKIIVNLAPSRGRKGGSGLDVAIAIAVLVASDQLPPESVLGLGFLGELGLDGSVRPVPGIAPMAGVLDEVDLVVPVRGAVEARAAAVGRVRGVMTLREVIEVLGGDAPWPDHPETTSRTSRPTSAPDLRDVRGQLLARRAIEIAASGGHHTLLVGPPGSGKSMLATRLPGLLPQLDRRQSLEATMVHSAAGLGLPDTGLVVDPPFRSPHHTCSLVSLVGGGSFPVRPGEISMAHCGVLFLDELTQFGPAVLNGLREPLETGIVNIDRAKVHTVMPAEVLLVAAMNPCPCGGGPPGRCACGDAQLRRYLQRISGPLLDRFDLRVPVERPGVDELLSTEPGEPTAVVRERVRIARAVAHERQGCLNARLEGDGLDRYAPLDASATTLLRREMELDRLSGRGYHRVRRVARTIVDLAEPGRTAIGETDVALGLRLRGALSQERRLGWVA